MTLNPQGQQSAYQMVDEIIETEKHTIGVIVDNEAGVLSRVIGVFTGRGYNIDSLTVSEIDHAKDLSRITIITRGSPKVINQIMALLNRLVPVHEVRDLTIESPHIEREVALVKVVTDDEQHRLAAQKLADRFGARTIDSTPKSYIFELSDMPEKLDKFIQLLQPYGVYEVCRTGVTAIARGLVSMNHDVTSA